MRLRQKLRGALWTAVLATAVGAGVLSVWWPVGWARAGVVLAMLAWAGLCGWALVHWLRGPLDQLEVLANKAAELSQDQVRSADTELAGASDDLLHIERALAQAAMRQQAWLQQQSHQWDRMRGGVERDAGTGVLVRRAFMGRLASVLLREDAPDAGVLVLVRIGHLYQANQRAGHQDVDAALAGLGACLLRLCDAWRTGDQAFAGRLNGTDFAVCLPGERSAAAMGDHLAAQLESDVWQKWPAVFPEAAAVASTGFTHGEHLSGLLAQADQVLAQAEMSPARQVAVSGDEGMSPLGGESHWRQLIQAALSAGQLSLASFPVRDQAGQLIHLSCPVRLALLQPDQPEPAARWLPLAVRTGMLADVEVAALRFALATSARDGQRRSLNVGLASMERPSFQELMLAALKAQGAAAALLRFDVSEDAMIQAPQAVRAFGAAVRACGANWGVSHAGRYPELLQRVSGWTLDYVKVDFSVWSAAEEADQRRALVHDLTAALHGMGILVCAEGVSTTQQADELFSAGMDAVTGAGVP